MSHMCTDLVRSSCFQPALDERRKRIACEFRPRATKWRDHFVMGHRFLCVVTPQRVDDRHFFSVPRRARQRRVDGADAGARRADERLPDRRAQCRGPPTPLSASGGRRRFFATTINPLRFFV